MRIKIIPVAMLAVVAVVVAGPASAALASTARAVSVSRSVSAGTLLLGQSVRITGRAVPSHPATPVRLQRYTSGAWHNVLSTTTNASSAYSMVYRPSAVASSTPYRVYTLAEPGFRAGTSTSWTLTVRPTAVVSLTNAATAAQVRVGQVFTVTGRATPARVGSPVSLQRLVAGKWGNLVNSTARTYGNVAISYRPTTVGSLTLRLSKPAEPGYKSAAATAFALKVIEAAPAITTTALGTGIAGLDYKQVLTVTGGRAPYVWSATGLPTGLTLSTDGIVTGTPTGTGSSPVNLTVRDTTADSATRSVGTKHARRGPSVAG